MCDKGFDFYWQDDFRENIFAEHFVAYMNSHYYTITAFEIVEHLPEPLTANEKLLLRARNIMKETTKYNSFENFEKECKEQLLTILGN